MRCFHYLRGRALHAIIIVIALHNTTCNHGLIVYVSSIFIMRHAIHNGEDNNRSVYCKYSARRHVNQTFVYSSALCDFITRKSLL